MYQRNNRPDEVTVNPLSIFIEVVVTFRNEQTILIHGIVVVMDATREG